MKKYLLEKLNMYVQYMYVLCNVQYMHGLCTANGLFFKHTKLHKIYC